MFYMARGEGDQEGSPELGTQTSGSQAGAEPRKLCGLWESFLGLSY